MPIPAAPTNPNNPNPFTDEALFDHLVLTNASGTYISPGYVTLEGASRKAVYDIKAGPSLAGASTNLSKIPPCEFSTRFLLTFDPTTGENSIDTWDAFAKVLKTSIKSPAGTFKVYHPQLAAIDVTCIALVELGQMVWDGKGGAAVTCKWLEYHAPRKLTATALSATPPGTNLEAKAMVKLLSDQFSSTPWGADILALGLASKLVFS